MRYFWLICWLVPASLWGQNSLQLQWRSPRNEQAHSGPEAHSLPHLSALSPSDSSLSPTPQLLPRYARENPTGFSFLCRQELAIQRRWPVALWVDIEDNPNLKGQIMTTPHLRLQVPLK